MEFLITRINIKEAQQVKIKDNIKVRYNSHIFYKSNHMALNTKAELLDNQEINKIGPGWCGSVD